MRARNAVDKPRSRGAVMTEYAVLVGVVSLVLVAAILATYPRLALDYARTTAIVGGAAP